MNVPNILSQYTMNVRLELLQKFKIKNMLTFCVRPNHNIIMTKCIIKYFRYDPQKFLKHGYKPLVWYIKTKACTYVHCDINLQEHITAVTLCLLEDASLRHKFADNGLVNKRGWRSIKHNSSNIKHIMWYWGYMFQLYWVIFRPSCTRSIQRMHYALWDPQRLQ